MTEFEKRLEALLDICIEELAAIGMHPSPRILSVRVNRRAVRRLGVCFRYGKGPRTSYRIEISAMLDQAAEQTLKEVIIHELLHTCPGCYNHGPAWKAYAAQIHAAYGYEIKRTGDLEAMVPEEQVRARYRYRVFCKSCGKSVYRMKQSKLVKNVKQYRCAACGGRLEAESLWN